MAIGSTIASSTGTQDFVVHGGLIMIICPTRSALDEVHLVIDASTAMYALRIPHRKLAGLAANWRYQQISYTILVRCCFDIVDSAF